MSRQLVLWRHGRTRWNAAGRAQGQTDIGLDDLGRAQSAAAAPVLASLEPTAIVSSDLSRAADTADALAKVLRTLRPLTAGRLIAVFGSAGERDATKRAPMGRVAGELTG